ncbi:MAG: hypothetical protein F6K54_12115 [Okeania sp. SIO3B5]|uniref:hypothetical protein n=1 Tax=Okeania sp. SIO3B5 TaxID=2607811 RepID=UPI0013FF72ED|nr:hypothetical protein [Okeania sp. SIO3B5]NEO53759.1 hypothetical protein [Okeania sp. SIO3B5]
MIRFLEPLPVAVITKGDETLTISFSGVDLPTQLASNQCALERFCRHRLYLVNPFY